MTRRYHINEDDVLCIMVYFQRNSAFDHLIKSRLGSGCICAEKAQLRRGSFGIHAMLYGSSRSSGSGSRVNGNAMDVGIATRVSVLNSISRKQCTYATFIQSTLTVHCPAYTFDLFEKGMPFSIVTAV